MVTFYSYVSLPEGTAKIHLWVYPTAGCGINNQKQQGGYEMKNPQFKSIHHVRTYKLGMIYYTLLLDRSDDQR